METISNTVEVFVRDRDHYIRIKEQVDALCKEKLSKQGIGFLWDSRVKQPESLREKLQNRIREYDSEAANVNDIKDLVAGRVILTRWKDFGLVENVIEENFNLVQRSQHPKSAQNLVTLQQRFRGYDGLHFYVIRRGADGGSDGGSYSKLIIEIQVMSGFMWTYATLEHDVTYKEKHGEPDRNLIFILNILKGIANVGEVAMEVFDDFLRVDFKPPCFPQDNIESVLREKIRELKPEKQNAISQNLDRNKKIIAWISKADVENDHAQMRTTLGWHYKDSGQWFRPTYQDWIASPDTMVFWLAGSGLYSLLFHRFHFISS